MIDGTPGPLGRAMAGAASEIKNSRGLRKVPITGLVPRLVTARQNFPKLLSQSYYIPPLLSFFFIQRSNDNQALNDSRRLDVPNSFTNWMAAIHRGGPIFQ